MAGSFFPSFEDPQDWLHIPANLTPRRVRSLCCFWQGLGMSWWAAGVQL